MFCHWWVMVCDIHHFNYLNSTAFKRHQEAWVLGYTVRMGPRRSCSETARHRTLHVRMPALLAPELCKGRHQPQMHSIVMVSITSAFLEFSFWLLLPSFVLSGFLCPAVLYFLLFRAVVILLPVLLI